MTTFQGYLSQTILAGIFLACFICAIVLVIVNQPDSSSINDHNSDGIQLQSWITTCNTTTGAVIDLLQPSTLSQQRNTNFNVTIEINANIEYQDMLGYGAGLPQASASVLISLKERNQTAYDMVLKKLFTSSEEGAKMNFLRFPIGSCDFSLTSTSTTYDEVQGNYNLSYFAIDDDSQNYIVQVLKDVKAIRPDLKIIATPWSPPSWLKVNDSLVAYSDNNTLIDTQEVYLTYTRYLVYSLLSFKQQGLFIDYLALQNEPLFGTGTEYPGMYLSTENAVRLAGYIAPELSVFQTQLLAYDHNWDVPSYPMSVLGNSSGFDGIAWHCYSGSMADAQDMLHENFPRKPQMVTECTGSYPNGVCDITQGMTDFGYNHEWDMENILLGAAGHWATAGLKWIIALDENCGPTLPTVTYNNGRPLVAIPSTANSFEEVYFNQDYWTIAHMSKFVGVGSKRVNSVVNAVGSGAGGGENVLAETFVNTVSGEMTLIIMNLNHDEGMSLNVSASYFGQVVDYLPPFSTKIYQWSTL